MRRLSGLAGLLLATAAGPVLAQAPAELTGVAAGKWTVDFAEQRCIAHRAFKAAGRDMVLGIEPSPTGEGGSVLLRMPADTVRGARRVAGYRPGKLIVNGAEVERRMLVVFAPPAPLLLRSSYSGEAVGAVPLERMERVELRSEAVAVALPLDGMARLTPVVARCNRSLLESYGIAATEQDRVASWPRAKQNLAAYFTVDDYPNVAVRQEQQGETEVRLSVRADGGVGACHVRSSSGSPSLDRQTCAVLQERARFEPARDRSGAAMDGLAFTRILWLLPDF